MKKILACILAVALLTCVFAACGKTEDKGDSSSDLKLALVVAGTFGDRSFYDSSKEGADRLAKDFGVQVSTIECNNENHATQMKNAADQADVVVCVGWEFYDVETIAPEYPNVKFIWIDNATSEPVANVLNITYAQNEGSFLAGYIAAAMSESGTVGAVGGEDSDTINDFIVGYTQGAEYYGTENGKAVNVVKNYAGTYDDPAKGKECALALHDQGADVIFQIASACGDGVFEAAKEKGFYTSGQDVDLTDPENPYIVSSQIKDTYQSVWNLIDEFFSGNYTDENSVWGVAEGTIGAVYVTHDSPNPRSERLSDDDIAPLKQIAEDIRTGALDLTNYPTEEEYFAN